MRDKTYYMVVDGKTLRVRAEKKPNKETLEALTAMARLVYNIKFKQLES